MKASQLVLLAAGAAVLLAALAYSRRLGDELLAQLEIDELERIPVQGE